ncbi:hypothetical protein, partial [Vulcanococcus sp.]|uniref:hypothetical protein n=1 Tax=Vulcanococcus sp. TaxID=2856995 RepID=UPI003BFB7E05
MTTYARIDEAGKVIETCQADPTELFAAPIAAEFVKVPDGVSAGDVKEGTKFVTPVVELPPEPEFVEPPISKADFYGRLSSAERIAIRGARATDPVADDFLLMLEETGSVDLSTADSEAALAHFVAEGYLTAERVDE